jgi:hypothetical protein
MSRLIVRKVCDRNHKSQGQAKRNQNGMGVAAILSIGLTASMLMGAMMAMVLPTYQKTTLTRSVQMIRCANEAALDAVVADMNRSIVNNVVSPYDATTVNQYTTTNIPSTMTGQEKVSTSVTVRNIPPSQFKHSTIYDPLVEQRINAPAASPDHLENPYRVIEATSSIGGHSRTIRTVIEPVFDGSFVFPLALFGKDGMTNVGRVTTDSTNGPDSRLFASTGSNVAVTHVGMSNYGPGVMSIGGNQYEFGAPSAQAAQMASVANQFNATQVSQAPWVVYNGNVYSNGSTAGHYPRGPADAAGTNTWKNVNGFQNTTNGNSTVASTQPGGNWTGGQTYGNQSYGEFKIADAPSAPPGAINLGNVNLSGSAKIVFQSGATPPTGPISTMSSGTVTLPPGDYVVNSVNMTGTSQIQIANGTGTNTRLYVSGNSSGNTAVNVTNGAQLNNVGTNLSASKLQFFYNGSKDIAIDGSSRSLVYAPNAKVMIGTGPPPGQNSRPLQMDYYGSVVGKQTYLWGGWTGPYVNFHYEYPLMPPNFVQGGDTAFLTPRNPIAGGVRLYQANRVVAVRAITWQETW